MQTNKKIILSEDAKKFDNAKILLKDTPLINIITKEDAYDILDNVSQVSQKNTVKRKFHPKNKDELRHLIDASTKLIAVLSLNSYKSYIDTLRNSHGDVIKITDEEMTKIFKLLSMETIIFFSYTVFMEMAKNKQNESHFAYEYGTETLLDMFMNEAVYTIAERYGTHEDQKFLNDVLFYTGERFDRYGFIHNENDYSKTPAVEMPGSKTLGNNPLEDFIITALYTFNENYTLRLKCTELHKEARGCVELKSNTEKIPDILENSSIEYINTLFEYPTNSLSFK